MVPLDLYVEITKPDGRTFRFDGQGRAENVARGIVFASKRMEGFDRASFVLPRRVDRDYLDISLYDDVAIIAADGTTRYEGRVSATPRQLDQDGHSISVECVGWMAHTRDRKFQYVYVDRDPTAWQGPTLARRAALTSWVMDDAYKASAESGGIKFDGTNQAISGNQLAEVYYTMPYGLTIGKLGYKGTQANTTNVTAPLLWTDDNDAFSSANTTSLTLDDTVRLATVTTPERYGLLQAASTASFTPTGLQRLYKQIAVYADHGLTTRSITGEPDGLYVSDVLEHIVQNFCPKLTWAGDDTTYPVSQIAFKDLTDPYDAMVGLNPYHLWDLAVWEGKRVTYSPVDVSDYDWQVRTDEPGVTMNLQGDTTDSLANGIVVTYTNVTNGQTETLYPADHPELVDSSETNPANEHGIDAWIEYSLSFPAQQADALQVGRTILAENNQPKAPGDITIAGGYVKDRAGVKQPSSKVRAGETIAVVNHPNDRPRIITEASYADESHTLQIALDSTIKRADAFIDRVSTALKSNGLTA